MPTALDLAVRPRDTLGSGVLTGKYNRERGTAGRASLRGSVKERDLAIAAEVVSVAEKLGRTPAQVALAWVRQARGVMVPLVGARTREQLDDNLGCLDLELDPADKARLDEKSRIERGCPPEVLAEFRSDRAVGGRA